MLKAVNRQNIKYVSYLMANKYVLTFAIFMVWMTFFDKNNLITLSHLQDDIDTLIEERDYFDTELSKLDARMKAIQVDRERYARETFYLHRENEIVYLVR